MFYKLLGHCFRRGLKTKDKKGGRGFKLENDERLTLLDENRNAYIPWCP